MLNRRAFLASAALPLTAARAPGLKIGVMDGVLRQASRPEALKAAAAFGLSAVQVTLGRSEKGRPMLLEDPLVQRRYQMAMEEHRVRIDSTYIDLLHLHCLKSDRQAQEDVLAGIDVTRKLGARVLMTVFFGKCAIQSGQERDYVAEVFRDLAPAAEDAGVILGFENVLAAEDQARVVDRVESDAFKVYYDVGNATNIAQVDAAEEIRYLGRDRICQFHFKDKGYLGQGEVDFPGVLAAIGEIGFQGFAMLETGSPSGDAGADLRKNLDYLTGLMK